MLHELPVFGLNRYSVQYTPLLSNVVLLSSMLQSKKCCLQYLTNAEHIYCHCPFGLMHRDNDAVWCKWVMLSVFEPIMALQTPHIGVTLILTVWGNTKIHDRQT